MKQKTAIPLEITKGLTMLVWFIPLSNGLRKGHGSSGLSINAYIIEVDGMIEFVFLGDYNNGIARNFFLNRDVNTQEEADDKKAKQDHNKCLVSFSHSPYSNG